MSKEETKLKDIICSECGAGPFKSEAGLSGHRQIAHNVLPKKVEKNTMLQRLESIETHLASTVNPDSAIESEEKTIIALRLLLPSVEKYGLAVCSIDKLDEDSFLTKYIKEYRIIRNNDIVGGGGRLSLRQGAIVL